MTTERACMGGWCRLRENCERYLQPLRNFPIERRCGPGVADRYVPATYPVIPIREAA